MDMALMFTLLCVYPDGHRKSGPEPTLSTCLGNPALRVLRHRGRIGGGVSLFLLSILKSIAPMNAKGRAALASAVMLVTLFAGSAKVIRGRQPGFERLRNQMAKR